MFISRLINKPVFVVVVVRTYVRVCVWEMDFNSTLNDPETPSSSNWFEWVCFTWLTIQNQDTYCTFTFTLSLYKTIKTFSNIRKDAGRKAARFAEIMQCGQSALFQHNSVAKTVQRVSRLWVWLVKRACVCVCVDSQSETIFSELIRLI